MEEQDRHQQTFIQKAYASSCDMMSETTEYLASFSLGQSVLRQTDRLLWTVEKCAEWSIPNQAPPKHHNQNGTFGKAGPLVRPLPWLIFLPMLFFLRISRFILNIASLLLGFESVKAISMVKFIQVRRRRVRALKFLGLRRIRQRKQSKENISKMSFRERFYNIMSRAMCFRVTNSDMYEEITVKKTEEEPQSSSSNTYRAVRQRSGKDLKRKYIEILKNNYYDWEDIEDDEELIDRITQLAEDDLENEDPDFLPAEDSATEDDSMSDAEDDAIACTVTPSSPSSASHSSPKQLQRLSSHGSIATEIIAEENEDSDSTTVSANSDDESSQALDKTDITKISEPETSKEEKNSLEPSVTSDEYYSPMNSIPASPEPKVEPETVKCINQNQNNTQTVQKDEKIESKIESINSDNQVKNSQNSLPPITARETNHSSPQKTNSNSHSLSSPRTKKKQRRRFSNLLRRKRK